MASHSDAFVGRSVTRFLGRCLVLGSFALVVLWVTIPVEPVPINVRWTRELTDGERITLESRFHLADGRLQDDAATWSYALFDYSRDNIRALVTHPVVLDTHHVDRSTFQPDNPPLGWAARVLACAALFAVGGAILMTALAGTLNVARFWGWTVAVAVVLVALRWLSVGTVERLLATAPWLPVSVMLGVGAVASLERRIVLTPRVLAVLVAGGPLVLFALAALMLVVAAFGWQPPWSAR